MFRISDSSRFSVYHSLLLLSFLVSLSRNADAEIKARDLHDGAIAVLTMNLDRFDAAQVDAVTSGPRAAAMTKRFADQFQSRLDQLRAAGVHQLHLVLAFEDSSRNTGYLVIPTPNLQAAKQIEAVIKKWHPPLMDTFFIKGTTVYCGAKSLAVQLESVSENGRHLQSFAPLETAFRLAIVPSQDQRKVLRDFQNDESKLFAPLTGEDIAAIERFEFDFNIDTNTGTIVGRTDAAATSEKIARTLPELVRSLRDVIPGFDATGMTVTNVDADQVEVRGSFSTELLAKSLSNGVKKLIWMVPKRDISNNLKMLGLANHNFHDTYGSFPPSASYDDIGKPLLSWRVHLLPYLDQQALYEKFHLDEPWDSEHNQQLISEMPEVFAPAAVGLFLQGKTTILVPLGKGCVFTGKAGIPIKEITDGTSNTIMLLDSPASEAVIWTKPADLNIDDADLPKALFGDRDSFWTTFCDGSARRIPNTIPLRTLNRILSRNDGKVVEPF